jgi:AraC-like DNA-binding protein
VSFYRNTHLRIQRNNQEGEVVHRIKNFVERCDEFDSEILAPRTEEIYNGGVDTRIDLSDDFVALMLKLIPYIHEQKTREITMRNLCDVAGIDISDMYTIVSANLYKSPRMLARIFRLQKACEMLTNTDVSLESIASECGFVTPNFFIANFYHQYKMTPKEFREKNGVPAT